MTPILSSQSGMSLVEVLVALFILALASAAIVMTLPRQPSRLDREVARLELAIDRLADEAIASGEVRAIRLGKMNMRPKPGVTVAGSRCRDRRTHCHPLWRSLSQHRAGGFRRVIRRIGRTSWPTRPASCQRSR